MKKTVTLDQETWEVFATLLRQCGDQLGNAGCNDFEAPDSPAVRELSERMDAHAWEMPLEEWRRHEDYEQPIVRDGTVLMRDDWLCDYFEAEVKRQALAEGTSDG